MEGLSPSDAILYPVMTGCLLTFLYYLIQWLKDPEILNLIINWYLSGFGIFAVAKLVSDSISVLRSFVFPGRFTDNGQLWIVEPSTRSAVTSQTDTEPQTRAITRRSPLPGILSRLPLPSIILAALWVIRKFLTETWLLVEIFAHDLFEADIHVGLSGTIGLSISVAGLLYFNLVSKPWWLTNLFGFSFSYSALQLMSPTTFWTGTLVLTSLFFYDIYFVFFTPMMVTVATKLDVPVKLLIPKPSDEDPSKLSLAMLGLGDIVLPGIMIGLALRFDLFLFYLKKQRRKDEETVADKPKAAPSPSSADEKAPIDLEPLQKSLIYDKTGLGKAKYVNATGGWGERFWLQGKNAGASEGGNFPKTYFYAGVFGYIIGMVCTVGIMHFAQHAQPALLYLVPSVLSSLWGTAYLKGELQIMWNFTEADDEEEKTKKAEAKKSAKENDSKDQSREEGGTDKGNKTEEDSTVRVSPNNKEKVPSQEAEKAIPKAREDHVGSSDRQKLERKGRYFFFAISKPTTSGPESKRVELATELVTGLRTISKGPVGKEPDSEQVLEAPNASRATAREEAEPPEKRLKRG